MNLISGLTFFRVAARVRLVERRPSAFPMSWIFKLFTILVIPCSLPAQYRVNHGDIVESLVVGWESASHNNVLSDQFDSSF